MDFTSEDEKDMLRISERKNLKRIISVPREEWKTFIGEELTAVLKLIPRDYDYELGKAKKGSK